MALGATVRPWKEVVGWKPWADATKSAPYNAVERITMPFSEADPANPVPIVLSLYQSLACPKTTRGPPEIGHTKQQA
jgi:hypothetical protein